jgi:hypothetical protein
MGRIGTLRARWAAWSRLRRAAVATAVLAGAAFAGAAVHAASGRGTPPPIVWHDQVSDSTATPTAAP